MFKKYFPIWGSYNINRLIQQGFRDHNLKDWEQPFGDQRIWRDDKVIQLINEKRDGYVGGEDSKTEKDIQLSNGQVGIVCSVFDGYANVVFSGYADRTFGYIGWDSKKTKLY